MKQIKVEFKKLNHQAKCPFRKHSGDAAYDIFATEDTTLIPLETKAIPTGLSLKMPEGFYCEVHTRSSHGVKGIKNHLGIIDEGYHGEITVLMTSLANIVSITKGERIAQLIFRERIEVDFEESNKDFESSRGEAGFGSTGK